MRTKDISLYVCTIPGLATTSSITCVMEVELLLTLWEGRSPGPVLPLSALPLPTLPPISSLLAVNPCFWRRLRGKPVLVSGMFFPIPSPMATASLPVIRFRAQKYFTADLGKRRSPGPLMARPFPFIQLSDNLGIIPHFAWARGQRLLR